jgi:phosphohistidine phosphatase
LAVYLVHHADAVAPYVDPMRPLSERGRADAAHVAEEAARRGVKPDIIWHSGKLRARQTAEVFWKACNPLASMTAVRGLLPDDPASWMRDQLEGETRSVLLVSHMPYLPRLLQVLSGKDESATAVFPQHGCVALERSGECWTERWRLEP